MYKQVIPCGITLLSIAIALLALAQASNSSIQEQYAVKMLNGMLSRQDNRLFIKLNDKNKTDDLQGVCLGLNQGMSIRELDKKMIENGLKITNEDIRKQTMGYTANVQVVAVNLLCPQYKPQLNSYIYGH